MPYKQMDVRSLSYEDGTFDAVIDKGTFDSILCGDGSGPNADQMLSEVHRVLSPNGVYICVSYGVKESRMAYFQKKEFDWTVSHHMVAKPTISTSTVVSTETRDDKNFHWVYIMRKQAGAKWRDSRAKWTRDSLLCKFENKGIKSLLKTEHYRNKNNHISV